MYIPDQGDIVFLNFDPSTGKEIMKRRPAFVISKKIFNEHTGFALVAPITSTIRNIKLEVELSDDMSTSGSVLVHQMKSLDYFGRQVEHIESAPLSVTKSVTEIAKLVVS